MLLMLCDLIYHKAYANASLLKAIRQHESAAQDAELRKLLHHIILANRFWLSLILELRFDIEEESQVPESLVVIAARYRETHAREIEWVSRAQEADLARHLESPLIPVGSCSVAQALMQVGLHSHGHRAQCAARLRLLGGTAPASDFIFWLKERPVADWQ